MSGDEDAPTDSPWQEGEDITIDDFLQENDDPMPDSVSQETADKNAMEEIGQIINDDWQEEGW